MIPPKSHSYKISSGMFSDPGASPRRIVEGISSIGFAQHTIPVLLSGAGCSSLRVDVGVGARKGIWCFRSLDQELTVHEQ